MHISSTELEKLSNTRQSQEKLPLLLRRLITNNLDGKYIVNLDIPGGDSIWKPGADGYVQTLENSILGEAGIYLIECGQDESYQTKFQKDLDKRTENLSQNSNKTFVFITTRKVRNKDASIAKAQKKNPKANFWKNIRIFDADDIETWLEHDYATSAWLCDVLEKPFDDIYNFEKKWQDWIKSTIIPLDENIILARKNIYEKEINDWLLHDKGLIEVRACTKKESLLYLLASIMKISSLEEREDIKSKITIIEDRKQWNRVVENGNSKKLILVPMFDIPEGIHTLLEKGYTIYLPLAKKDSFQTNKKLDVDNICNYLLEPIIEAKYGYEYQKLIYKNFSNNDMLLLQRILRNPKAPLPKPIWANKNYANILLFLSIFSSWDDLNRKDIELIEKTLKIPYSEIKNKLIELMNIDEAPIQQIGNIFQVTNPKLLIEYLGAYLTKEQFFSLLKSVQEVLTTIDNEYSKEKDYFNFDFFHNKAKYSEQIKSSSTKGLALFANNDNYFNSNVKIKEQINRVIKDIFEDCDYKLWLFLGSYMPMLFEASPEIMLTETDRMLDNKVILDTIIEEGSISFGGNCYYAGILWGLESVAWLPEYLNKATSILLKMYSNWVNGSGYANSPLSSLHKIYCAWYPHTSVDTEDRKKILTTFINGRKYNEALTNLLIKLLPQRNESLCSSTEPSYLEYKRLKLKNADVWNMYNFVFEKLLILMDELNNWDILIGCYFDLSTDQKQKLYDKLNSLDFSTIQDDKKIEIQKAILLKTYWFDEFGKNKEFSKEDKNLIESLKTIISKINFSDKHKQYVALFTSYDYKHNDTIYAKKLKDLLDDEGIEGIIHLIGHIEDSYGFRLIDALKSQTFSEEQIKEILSYLGQNEKIDKILFNFIGQYFWNNEMPFINQYWNTNWKDSIKQNILLNLSSSPELWKWIETNHLENLYWSKKIFRGDFSASKLDFIIPRLKQYNNTDSLLEIVFYNKNTINTKEIVDALILYTGEHHLQLSSYYITELFDILYANNVEQDLLIKLEMKYLKILDHNGIPRAIKKELSTPASSFFSDIVKMLYGEESLDDDKREKIRQQSKNENDERTKELAISLMIKMDKNFIFENKRDIKSWFENNKTNLQKLNRLQYGLSFIGQMFGQSPNDASDNIWPLKEIREIIEAEESEILEKGILIGKHNSIGIRAITPDAKDMWTAYNEYKEYAKIVRFQYPRTSNLLEKIAAGYKELAESDENSHKQRYM